MDTYPVNAAHNPLLVVPGAAGSILKARSKAMPSNEFVVWPRLSASNFLEKFLWVLPENPDSTEINDINQDYEIFVPMDDHGLFACSDLAKGVYSGALPKFIQKFTGYFCSIVEFFESKGYVKGVNLFGCPFDWRKSLLNKETHSMLKDRVEFAYFSSGNLPVDVVCHSMGGLLFKVFLAKQPAEWVAKYVRNFITLATPWRGGSGGVLNSLILGYNGFLPSTIFPNKSFRGIQINSPSAYSCLPIDLYDPPRIFVNSEKDGWLCFTPLSSSQTPPSNTEQIGDVSDVSSVDDEFDHVIYKCEECCEVYAVLKCINCEGFLCQRCFDTTHVSKLLKRHKTVKLAATKAEREEELAKSGWGEIRRTLDSLFVSPSSLATEVYQETESSSSLSKLLRKLELPFSPDSSSWKLHTKDISELWSKLTDEGTMGDLLFKVRTQHLKEAVMVKTLTPSFTSTKYFNIYGAEVPTPYHSVFSKPIKKFSELSDLTPTYLTYRSGDGTVPISSACDTGMNPTRNIQIDGVGHVDILHSKDVINIIYEILSS
ncbi:hypothetical protein P9112_006697 [Eukaryota sp. TZLM1-RC]